MKEFLFRILTVLTVGCQNAQSENEISNAKTDYKI